VRVAAKWSLNPKAREVFEAFGLSSILEVEAPAIFAQWAIKTERATSLPAEAPEHLQAIVTPFLAMADSVDAWERLVVPQELRGETLPDDILSIQVRDENNVPLQVLRETLNHIELVYSSLSTLLGVEGKRLEIISIQSGSPVSINLKGSGDIVKQFRLCCVEFWSKIRLRSHDDLLSRNDVLLSTLSVMSEIDKKTHSGVLSPEAGGKLKRDLTKGMLGLVNCHALPVQIEAVEIISNDLLLNGFHPRLLGSESYAVVEQEVQISGTTKKTSRSKASSKGSKKTSKKIGK
jgi:hypothetical protein